MGTSLKQIPLQDKRLSETDNSFRWTCIFKADDSQNLVCFKHVWENLSDVKSSLTGDRRLFHQQEAIYSRYF